MIVLGIEEDTFGNIKILFIKSVYTSIFRFSLSVVCFSSTDCFYASHLHPKYCEKIYLARCSSLQNAARWSTITICSARSDSWFCTSSSSQSFIASIAVWAVVSVAATFNATSFAKHSNCRYFRLASRKAAKKGSDPASSPEWQCGLDNFSIASA